MKGHEREEIWVDRGVILWFNWWANDGMRRHGGFPKVARYLGIYMYGWAGLYYDDKVYICIAWMDGVQKLFINNHFRLVYHNDD